MNQTGESAVGENKMQINELASALAKAQGKMKAAAKTGHNTFFDSYYSTLEDVWEACRAPLSENGLSISQLIGTQDGRYILTTKLMHTSGQCLECVVPIPLQKTDVQSLGSAVTYLKRYCLSAIVGVVADEDDDGEAAMERKNEEKNKTAPPPQPKQSAPTTVKKPLPPTAIKAPVAPVQRQPSPGAPAAPTPESTVAEGSDWVGNFVVPIGTKYKGRKLKDIEEDDLKSFFGYITRELGKKVADTVDAQATIRKIDEYLRVLQDLRMDPTDDMPHTLSSEDPMDFSNAP